MGKTTGKKAAKAKKRDSVPPPVVEDEGVTQTPSEEPVEPEKPKETDLKEVVLTATLQRVDNAGSFIAEKVDNLGEVSLEILRSVGKCLGDGMSKVYKPAAIYLEGKAKAAVEANRIVKLAEAEAKVELIRSEKRSEQALMEADFLEELAQRTKTRFVNQELFRQANLEAVIEESIQIAEKEHGDTSAVSIDESWMWKFIEGAQNVSEEELREFWARILSSKGAGNDIRPIVLDVLRLFDKELATSFRRISLFCILYNYISASELSSTNDLEDLVDVGVLEIVDRSTLEGGLQAGVFSLTWKDPSNRGLPRLQDDQSWYTDFCNYIPTFSSDCRTSWVS
jgi:hypothetical protein